MKKNLKTPTRRRQKRKHGFLKRTSSKAGRKVVARRRKKGRARLTP